MPMPPHKHLVDAQMALTRLHEGNPNSKLKIEIIFADLEQTRHRRQYRAPMDRARRIESFSMSESSVALASAASHGSSTSDGQRRPVRALTGDQCTQYVHWTLTITRSPTAPPRRRRDRRRHLFFITADYAFATISRLRPRVVNAMAASARSVRAPFNTPDFSSYLLQAQSSKAKVISSPMPAATPSTRSSSVRFGIVKGGQRFAGLLVFITDVHSLGLDVAQACNSPTFYWDMNDDTRAWTKRFVPDERPSLSDHEPRRQLRGMLHYLKAVDAHRPPTASKWSPR